MPCINAVSFHEDPSIESICRKAILAGFDAIELSRPPFYYKLPSHGTRARFAEWTASQGLRLYGFDCWVNVLPYGEMTETVAEFRAAVQFANELKLGMIISHDSWIRDNGDRSSAECMRANVELFRRVADLCADAELDLVLEPHPDTLSMDNRWCIDFVDGLERTNVGVVYDCCHYGVGQPESYVDTIHQLGKRIRHLHLSDGDRRTYAMHLPLGEGELELAAIIRALLSNSYCGTVTNDMYNYPLLEEGARSNAPKVRQIEAQLGARL